MSPSFNEAKRRQTKSERLEKIRVKKLEIIYSGGKAATGKRKGCQKGPGQGWLPQSDQGLQLLCVSRAGPARRVLGFSRQRLGDRVSCNSNLGRVTFLSQPLPQLSTSCQLRQNTTTLYPLVSLECRNRLLSEGPKCKLVPY